MIQIKPDLFKVKFLAASGRYTGLAVEKSDSNLYIALANVVDHMLEKLNRLGDRTRVKERTKARKIAQEADQKFFVKTQKTG